MALLPSKDKHDSLEVKLTSWNSPAPLVYFLVPSGRMGERDSGLEVPLIQRRWSFLLANK